MPRKLTKREERIISLAKSGGTDKELVILDEVAALEEKFDAIVAELKADFKQTVEEIKAQAPDINNALKSIRGQDGKDGQDSTIPGPKGNKGDRGERGFSGKDGKDGKDGLNGKDGIDGKNTFPEEVLPLLEERLPQFGEKIRDSLELLQDDNRLDMNAIKGLEDLIKELKTALEERPLGGRGGVINVGVRFETPTGTIDETNATFYVNKVPKYVIVDGVVYFDGNGYTRSGTDGKTLTLSVPPRGWIRSAY